MGAIISVNGFSGDEVIFDNRNLKISFQCYFATYSIFTRRFREVTVCLWQNCLSCRHETRTTQKVASTKPTKRAFRNPSRSRSTFVRLGKLEQSSVWKVQWHSLTWGIKSLKMNSEKKNERNSESDKKAARREGANFERGTNAELSKGNLNVRASEPCSFEWNGLGNASKVQRQ